MTLPQIELAEGEYHDLCALVGHLFICFARVEGALASRLKLHLASKIGSPEVGLPLASAIYGSQRFSSLKDTTKRLAVTEKADKAVLLWLDRVFSHVGDIQKLRDMIAHQQLLCNYRSLGARWQIANATTVRDIEAATIIGFEEDTLERASDDLDMVQLTFGLPPKGGKLFGPDFDTPELAWRYKPSLLKTLHSGRRRHRG